MTNPIVINVAIDKWYPRGQARLFNSLYKVGWESMIGWVNNYPMLGYNESNPYTCKASELEYALNNGNDVVLWCDCSIEAIKDIRPIMEQIANDGYYFWPSGENCAQTSSDKALEYFDVTRDQAEKMPEANTSVWGVNLNSDIGKNFALAFIEATKAGIADGSREHDNQSQDPRFKYHRQDQTVASLILNKMGLSLDQNRYVAFKAYLDEYDIDKVIFTNQGM